MRSATILVCRFSCLVALLGSSALYWHYLDPASAAFCSVQSGCEAVRQSFLAHFGSRYLSLPLMGLVAFAGFFALSLQERPARSRWFRAAAYAAGSVGVLLLSIQLILIGQLCWLCAVVDTAAMVAAGSALLHVQADAEGFPWPENRFELRPSAWVGLALFAVAGPYGYYWLAPEPPLPGSLAERQHPGKIDVVELADFECPYCRKLHAVLTSVLHEFGERVAFERVHVPLEQHAQARPAAIAAICAERQGRAEQMANELFSRRLADGIYVTLAREIGLDVAAFETCSKDEQTEQRLAADRELASELGYPGLPTTYVGSKRIVGAQSGEVYRRAIEQAERHDAGRGVFIGYLLLLVVSVGLVLAFGRIRTRPI